MKKMLAAFALVTTMGLTLTACGDDSASDADGTSESSGQAAKFNDADVDFAQQMIPHHQQAIEMSQLAKTRAGATDVKTLAEDIEKAQGPEIETLTGWLEQWGEDAPSGEMDHGDMGHDMGDGAMSGMMDAEQMKDLENASGTEFDRMFLESMIEHHQGAVEMAQTEVDDGKNPDAIAMAEKVISDQQAEIKLMSRLLGS